VSVGGLLLLVLVGGFCVLVALWPFLSTHARTGPASQEFGAMSALAQLRAEREAVLQATRELDFDFQTGKLVKEDYHRQRESLIQRGVEILRQLEAQESVAIEAAIAAARGKQ
jgi:hypothetical protein